MTIYFAFSDESGLYRQDRTIEYNRRYPYYLRASLIIDGDTWYNLDQSFRQLKEYFQISQETEIKYADVWTLRNYQQNRTRKLKRRLIPLQDYPPEDLEQFMWRSLSLLDNLPYVNIIITVSTNQFVSRISEINLYKMHIQNLMQRIQMELQTDRDPNKNENLCLIFMDPISREKNEILTDAYNDLFLTGDWIEKYFVIKDCLHFELSHHSSGIQFADFIAGSTLGYLQGGGFSSLLFNEKVKKYIRRCPLGVIMGCGIIDIPSRQDVRDYLADRFQVD